MGSMVSSNSNRFNRPLDPNEHVQGLRYGADVAFEERKRVVVEREKFRVPPPRPERFHVRQDQVV